MGFIGRDISHMEGYQQDAIRKTLADFVKNLLEEAQTDFAAPGLLIPG